MHTRTLAAALLVAAIALLPSSPARAHCQVPCGIYDDDLRFSQLEEHFRTIEKAMGEIVALGKADAPNYNQIVRWVTTKEAHAEEVVTILTDYFLLQRVKVPAAAAPAAERDRYAAMLRLVHGALVATMKSKQTTDPAHVAAARKQVHDFRHHYEAK